MIKRIGAIIFMGMILSLFFIKTTYAQGLVYDTKALENNKIRITLKWSIPAEAKGISISYYYLENSKILNIGYELNAKASKTAVLDFDLKNCIPPLRIIISKFGDLNWRPFKDIQGIEADKYIWHLHDAGIIDLGKNELFRPKDFITRAVFAELICKALKLSGTDTNIKKLTDVGKTAEKKYILAAVNKGILSSNNDKTFKPQNNMTIAEVCTCVAKVFTSKNIRNGIYIKLKPNKAYSASVKKIFDEKLFNISDSIYKIFNEENKISRADCAMLISRALTM